VGRAYKFLLEQRMELGPQSAEDAEAALRAWWAQQPESRAAEPEAHAPTAEDHA
jgi:poly(A) polymerase